MMQIRSLVFAAFILSLAACNQKSDSNSPSATDAGNQGYQNISSLPLEEGIRAKYSRLQLICAGESESREPQEGGTVMSSVKTTLPDEVVWDLLKDFQPAKKIELVQKAGLATVKVNLDLALDLATGALEDRALTHKRYEFKNSARLQGPVKSKIVEVDEKGNVIFSTSTGGDNARVFNEQVVTMVLKEGAGDDESSGFAFDIHCRLDSELKPAYSSEFNEFPL